MKKILLLLLLLQCILWPANAQSVNISGIVNTYTSVVSIDPCDHNKLDVASAVGFNAGDRVLIIQMQGLVIDASNSASFGSFNSSADSTTGLYEIATILNISANTISFSNDILNKYNTSAAVQMVNIPQYTNAVVTATLLPQAWNGSTGGVLAIEASGTITLNANISAQGRGFRGGKRLAPITNSCGFLTNVTDYATDTLTWQYKSFKGEGVANYIANKWGSRGPQANGGGGGNDHNSGGGGGANKAAGGIGGRNNEPGTFNCKGYQPGLGGLSLSSLSGDRIFMGGGGGTGHENNNVNFAGGNGGGIIYIKANTIVGGGRIITASGDSSLRGGQDGGSGGGAAGTIKLDVLNYSGNLTVSANGGKGATTDNANAARCFGPGGGGSGGVICLSNTSVPVSVGLQTNGGAPGVVYRSSNGCNGSSNSATAGGTGSATLSCAGPPQSTKVASNCNPLPVTWLYFEAVLVDEQVQLHWATAVEINNDQFEVQRSSDGINYQTIGIIDGKGNSSEISYYEFIDSRPAMGVNYYRIKQIDLDKKYSYSYIKYIYFGLNWNEADILIYPNPLEQQSDMVHVIFPSTNHQLRIDAYDVLGNLVVSRDLSREQGYNGDVELTIPSAIFGQILIIQLSAENGQKFSKKLILY